MLAIGGLVLAAGGSTRLGQTKQLIEFEGETLVHAAVRAAREGGCDPVCVVTGHERIAVEGALADLSVWVVHNENWPEGMGGSLRVGLEGLGGVSAVVVLACDQPAVNGDIVRSIIRLHETTAKPIVASSYAETLGIPALFHQACFPELLSLPNPRGAKSVIYADLDRVVVFEFPDGAMDFDTPADLHKWQELRHPRRRDARHAN